MAMMFHGDEQQYNLGANSVFVWYTSCFLSSGAMITAAAMGLTVVHFGWITLRTPSSQVGVIAHGPLEHKDPLELCSSSSLYVSLQRVISFSFS